jgi:hypothetical protein
MSGGFFSDTVRDFIAATGLILAVIQIWMAAASSRRDASSKEVSQENLAVTERAVRRFRSLVADEQLRRSLLFAVTTGIILVVAALQYATSSNFSRIDSILKFRPPIRSALEVVLYFVIRILPIFQGIGFAGLLHVSSDETNADRVFWQRTFTVVIAGYTTICVTVLTATASAGSQLFAGTQIYALMCAIGLLLIIWGVPKVMSWIDS